MGGPFSENVRRMYERNSTGGAGADFAEEMEAWTQDWQGRNLSARGNIMKFSKDPTARGDEVAEYVREWYEANRESWWARFRRRPDVADNFMIGLVWEVRRVLKAAGEKL